MNDTKQSYLDYLKTRSLTSFIYRNLYLYPVLCSYITGRALDVGCGIGDFLRFRKDTIGVDVNPEIVRFCTSSGLDVRVSDGISLPFTDISFDSVIFDNVLEHLSDPDALLGEASRVMRFDARLIVGVPGKKGFENDADHKIFYNETSLRSKVQSHGFTWLKTLRMPLPFDLLSERLSSFAIYGVFEKSRNSENDFQKNLFNKC